MSEVREQSEAVESFDRRPPGEFDVCVLGGAGHVGLPLSILLADRGMRTLILDVNARGLEEISRGTMPFREKGAEPLLRQVLAKRMLAFSTCPASISGVATLIVTIGTPVDEFHSPVMRVMTDCFRPLLPYMTDKQLVILRSTVVPGVTDWLSRELRLGGKPPLLSFCPERVVQGRALVEMQEVPQLVSGVSPEAEDAAAAFFERIAPEVVRLSPIEAKFAKLLSNAYRYIQFAASNQFYTIAASLGVDYYRVLNAMKLNYPRLRDFPGAGFAAGPCLFKDTMQLAAGCDGRFSLGHAAMVVNEGLPAFLEQQIAPEHPLAEMTVGLLGMAFKADSDDIRASLSYKLKKLLLVRAKAVLTADPFVTEDPDILPLEQVMDRSDLLIVCAPHSVYRNLHLEEKPVVDIWNAVGRQVESAEKVASPRMPAS